MLTVVPDGVGSEDLDAVVGDAALEAAVCGDDVDGATGGGFFGDELDDGVVPGVGGDAHLDGVGAGDGAGLAFDYEDHVDGGAGLGEAGGSEGGEGVPQAYGGAGAVAPPAVGDGSDDVGGVDDEQRLGHATEPTT